MSLDAFVQAAREGNIGTMTRLQSTGVPVDGFASRRTALMVAANETTVRNLLSWGANVNLTNDLGFTALMFSCIDGNMPVAELLLRNGANYSLKNKYGETALDKCKDSANRTRIQAIINSLGAKAATTPMSGQERELCVDAFLKAARDGNVDELTKLRNNGFPIDGCDGRTMTALMCASGSGRENVVRLLVSWGANLNLTTGGGYTALMYACTNGHVSVAEILLRNRANHILKTTYDRKTAIDQCRDPTKRAQIQAVIDSLRTGQPQSAAPASSPAPAPAPVPVPASNSAWTATSTAGSTTEQQLHSQLGTVTNERNSFQRQLADCTREKEGLSKQLIDVTAQLAQSDTAVAENFRTIDQLTTQLATRTRERDVAVQNVADRTRERDAATRERDAVNAQLASRTRERDAAIRELDQLRLTATSAKPNSGEIVICPFQRYRTHSLVSDIVPTAVGPGIHSVADNSPLFTYCKALAKSGGQRFCPVAGHRLAHVQAIVHDDETQAVYTGTQLRMKRLRTQGGGHFNFTTASGFGLDQLNVLSMLRDQFHERAPGEIGANSINTVYCYHGPRREHLGSVCSTGLVAVRGTDAGFFGSGCYTTLNMEYALRYARGEFDADGGPRPTPDARYPVVMFAATVGMAYPVTPGADYGNEAGIRPGHSDYFGRPLEPGFDCHVVCVNHQSGFQAVTKDHGEYVELVFDQQSQLLPIAVLWFEEI